MNKKQLTVTLKGELIHMSVEQAKKTIKQHLQVKNKSRTVFVKLDNGNSRIISHAPLGEPQFFWPWPISILQWLFVCSLNVHEFSSSNEEINDKQFLFKDFNKAVNLFLDGVTANCLIQLQGKNE